MDFDDISELWFGPVGEKFTHGLELKHRRQVGGTCVSTGLSVITQEEPKAIREVINTQDPVSWSQYLKGHNLKLAYCPSDFRRLENYADDLLRLDDLFTISTYSPGDPLAIGADPTEGGWVCGSHFVILHRDTVYDTRFSSPIKLREYEDLGRYIKRIFRVVPEGHARGL